MWQCLFKIILIQNILIFCENQELCLKHSAVLKCMCIFLFIKGKQFNPTVLGYAQTPEGHFRRVQNESIRFNASAHHRPLEHFDRMQPATRLIGTFTRKVSLTFIYLFIIFLLQ